jgi:hypothetical protein
MSDKYSYCESTGATAIGKWHIRKLTKKGRKLGGGIDTSSLCKHVIESWGWDINTPITHYLMQHICKECYEIYLEEMKNV